jgi:hypothetical protein
MELFDEKNQYPYSWTYFREIILGFPQTQDFMYTVNPVHFLIVNFVNIL